MITLSRHIELLLLEHDCVIVPGLGGFIANHMEAHYDQEGDRTFLPPYRTVVYNQQLQINDGLLVQSYMAAYDASYPAAYLQMEKEITQATDTLEMTGEYIIENVGTLRKGIGSNISFTATTAGLTTPSLFGLDQFEMPSLESIIAQRQAQSLINQQSIYVAEDERDDETKQEFDSDQSETKHEDSNNDLKKERKEVVIKVNRRWIDFGISAAAAIILFFCLSYSAMKEVATETDTVIAALCPLPGKIAPTAETEAKDNDITTNLYKDKREHKAQPTTAARTAAKDAETSKAEASKVENGKTEVTKTEASKAETGAPTKAQSTRYTIVLASYVGRTNAEIFIKNLAAKGYTKAEFTKTGKVNRIIYSAYQTEAEAQSELSRLKGSCAEFADSWILKL